MTTAKRTGGDRLVRMTDGKRYVEQVNTTFGIVVWGEKSKAMQVTLSDAVGMIADANRLGGHKLYAELVAG